jgi:hypothetical protein
MAEQHDRLLASKAKGAPAALKFHDAMTAALAGETSFAFGVVKEVPLFEGALAYPLKDAPAAAALGDALGHLDKDAAIALLEAQVGHVSLFDWTVKEENVGKLKALRYGLTFKTGGGLDPEIVKKLFGKVVDVYVAVADTRFLVTFGHDAKASLGRLASAKPAEPSGALADTLAATKGRDSFFQLDLGPVLALIPTVIKDKKAASLAKAEVGSIPLYGSSGGDGAGKVLSFDMTIPPVAFTNAGSAFREVMKANAAGGGGEEKAGQEGQGKAKKKERKKAE